MTTSIEHYVQFFYRSGYRRSQKIDQKNLEGVEIPKRAYAYEFYDVAVVEIIITEQPVICRSAPFNHTTLTTI